MNNENKMIEKNIELSAEFSRYLFEHPEMEEKVPSDAEIILLPDFDIELKEHNLKIGKEIESRGENVVYLEIKHLRPKILSRLENVELVSMK